MSYWKMKRGTEALVDAYTPEAGEPVWATDVHELRVGDGSTLGGIKVAGENQIKQTFRALVVLDLSGSAQANVLILHAVRAMTILSAILLYTEASSGDGGVTVEIGKESDADYYYTGTSESSKSQWYEKSVTLLATNLAAGDTLICGNAGSKVGTGEILVIIEAVVT